MRRRSRDIIGHREKVQTKDDERREPFLEAELHLASSFLLIKNLDECRAFAEEIIFYQHLRKQVMKALPGKKPVKEVWEKGIFFRPGGEKDEHSLRWTRPPRVRAWAV